MIPTKAMVSAMMPPEFREDLKMATKVSEQNTKAIKTMIDMLAKSNSQQKKVLENGLKEIRKELKQITKRL